VLSNTAMRESDMLEGIGLAEAALDMDFFQPVLPCFRSPAPGLVGFRDLRERGASERFLAELRSSPEILAVRLTLLLSGPAPADPESLELLGRRIMEASPHTLVQLVVDCDEAPPYPPWERAARAFYVPEHYFNQIHYYKVDRQERFSVRLTHLTGDPDVALRSCIDAQAPPFDLLLRFSSALLRDGSILDRLPPLLVEGGLAPEENRELAERYQGLEGLILRWER
jgi:hypothetical protein